MKNSHEKSKKFPIYSTGIDSWKPAHTIRNCDMPVLYQFFNPKFEQVQITGTKTINGAVVPNLLAALGYDVTWDEDEDRWYVKIPEEFRILEVQQTITKTW